MAAWGSFTATITAITRIILAGMIALCQHCTMTASTTILLECYGSVVEMYTSSILNSTSDHFENNRAGSDDGVVYSDNGHISVIQVNTITNVVYSDGGVFRLLQGTLEIREGNFSSM